jgi:hypothetical protein
MGVDQQARNPNRSAMSRYPSHSGSVRMSVTMTRAPRTDRQAVDPLHVAGGEARCGPVTDGPAILVEEEHRTVHAVHLRFDEVHEAVEDGGKRAPGRDHLEDLVLRRPERFLPSALRNVTRDRQQLNDGATRVGDRRQHGIERFQHAGRGWHQVLEPSPPAGAGLLDRLLGSPPHTAFEELANRAIQQLTIVRELEHAEAFRVDVEEPALEVENLHAVAGVLHDPAVEILGLTQRVLAALPFGDVGAGADHADRDPLLVPDHGSTRVEPAHAAVAMAHPVLGVVRRRLASDMRLCGREHPFEILGMHEPHPRIGVVGDLAIVVAEHFLQKRIDGDVACREIPVEHAHAGRQRGAPVSILRQHGGRGCRGRRSPGQSPSTT